MSFSDDQLISLVRRDDLLTPEQVRQAREASRMTGKSLLEVIRERRWLDDAEMAHVEAAAAIVRPPGMAAAGSSATAIGTAGEFAGSVAERPTVIPGVTGDREATVLSQAESERPTAAPAMRGATPKPPPRQPAPDPSAAPLTEPPVNRLVLLVAAILAAAIIAGMLAGLGKFVRSGRGTSRSVRGAAQTVLLEPGTLGTTGAVRPALQRAMAATPAPREGRTQRLPRGSFQAPGSSALSRRGRSRGPSGS